MKTLKNFNWLDLNIGLENKTYIQVIKFICVGLANTLVDISFYFILTRGIIFSSTNITIARIISFLSASICSFILNRLWTFKRRGEMKISEIIKFYITVCIGLAIAVASMHFFIQVFHFYDLAAIILSIIFTFLWNFSVSKLWVFNK